METMTSGHHKPAYRAAPTAFHPPEEGQFHRGSGRLPRTSPDRFGLEPHENIAKSRATRQLNGRSVLVLSLRQEESLVIEHRSAGGDNEFEYRLVLGAVATPPVTKKKSARARIEELARENAELKRRLQAKEVGAAHGC